MTLPSRWPIPALLAWCVSWLAFAGLRTADASPAAALSIPVVLCTALALPASTPWRRIFIACGFPVSLLASGFAVALPAWAWLVPLALLVCLYPAGAWRDAPLFPTPSGALAGLADHTRLAPKARLLDAGCGLGAGLIELRKEFPRARVEGIEWSRPLRFVCAWRCRFARIRRGELWQADWSPYALVYVFQRPESMADAAEKAKRELADGAWLAGLEFEAPHFKPDRVIESEGGRRLFLYRAPFGERVR